MASLSQFLFSEDGTGSFSQFLFSILNYLAKANIPKKKKDKKETLPCGKHSPVLNGFNTVQN